MTESAALPWNHILKGVWEQVLRPWTLADPSVQIRSNPVTWLKLSHSLVSFGVSLVSLPDLLNPHFSTWTTGYFCLEVESLIRQEWKAPLPSLSGSDEIHFPSPFFVSSLLHSEEMQRTIGQALSVYLLIPGWSSWRLPSQCDYHAGRILHWVVQTSWISEATRLSWIP